MISELKFRNSEIYVVTKILKETVFIPFRVFSGKISSKMELQNYSVWKLIIFFAINHSGVRDHAVWTIFVSLNLFTTLHHPNLICIGVCFFY